MQFDQLKRREFHHASRRGGRVATHGARAAVGKAADHRVPGANTLNHFSFLSENEISVNVTEISLGAGETLISTTRRPRQLRRCGRRLSGTDDTLPRLEICKLLVLLRRAVSPAWPARS